MCEYLYQHIKDSWYDTKFMLIITSVKQFYSTYPSLFGVAQHFLLRVHSDRLFEECEVVNRVWTTVLVHFRIENILKDYIQITKEK